MRSTLLQSKNCSIYYFQFHQKEPYRFCDTALFGDPSPVNFAPCFAGNGGALRKADVQLRLHNFSTISDGGQCPFPKPGERIASKFNTACLTDLGRKSLIIPFDKRKQIGYTNGETCVRPWCQIGIRREASAGRFCFYALRNTKSPFSGAFFTGDLPYPHSLLQANEVKGDDPRQGKVKQDEGDQRSEIQQDPVPDPRIPRGRGGKQKPRRHKDQRAGKVEPNQLDHPRNNARQAFHQRLDHRIMPQEQVKERRRFLRQKQKGKPRGHNPDHPGVAAAHFDYRVNTKEGCQRRHRKVQRFKQAPQCKQDHSQRGKQGGKR